MSEYTKVVKFIESSDKDVKTCASEAAKQFGHPHNTILAIYSQLTQKKLRKAAYIHSEQGTQTEYWMRYQSSEMREEEIWRIACDVGIPPVMLAKIFLDFSKESDTSSNLLKNPDLIRDDVLRAQVKYCLERDDQFGPNIDLIKKTVGEEYEAILTDKLTLMNISYKDEHVLRDQGYDKTPDILLSVPIAIGEKVINWIESKASFGDEHTHRQYLREQYWSYWNRFGAGLVIYWFGFIEEIGAQTEEKGIIVMDHMPSKVTTMI